MVIEDTKFANILQHGDALIVRPHWGNLILDGLKDWEIRGSNTSKRGTIYIAYSGSGMVYGQVDIVDSFPVDMQMLEKNESHHRIVDSQHMITEVYNHPHAWVMDNAIKYKAPFPYRHPKGAVIWVKDVSYV